MKKKVPDHLLHFWHVVSNVRPIYWISLYVAVAPLFALIYWALPEGQFRIPDAAPTDYGSWLYYSIVTITTLGFGDYTPAGGWAQGVTACEVMVGLIVLGFFLNAVGSMKSEIDVDAALEKRKRIYEAEQREKLGKYVPRLIHLINIFLAYCYAVTTPRSKRNADGDNTYNPDFSLDDMKEMLEPSGLAIDNSRQPAVERMLTSADNVSLLLDSVQNSVDLRQWPQLLEDCFSFVANVQMFASTDAWIRRLPNASATIPDEDLRSLYRFIHENASLAIDLEKQLSAI